MKKTSSSRMDQAQEAVDLLIPKTLKNVQIGETVRSKDLRGTVVLFRVSAISRGRRDYSIHLRTTEGYEWVVTRVKWEKI